MFLTLFNNNDIKIVKLTHKGWSLMLKKLSFLFICLLLAACDKTPDTAENPIRKIKTMVVQDIATFEEREFSAQLKPGDLSSLSFEVSGMLQEFTLEVGQKVQKGDILAQIDSRTFELEVERLQFQLESAKASLTQAQNEYDRQNTLAQQNLASQSKLDSVFLSLQTSKANVAQAQSALEIAEENLKKTTILAPYDGVISSVHKESFVQVSPGQVIAQIYKEGFLETRFLVPPTVVDVITIGDVVDVWIAPNKTRAIAGKITEIGALANNVSAFPIVVQITDYPKEFRAGVAARISIKTPFIDGLQGYEIPLSAGLSFSNNNNKSGTVFVYDQTTKTVKETSVHMVGVRGNNLVISDGLKKGDIIATAGVSFLSNGQQVELLSEEK